MLELRNYSLIIASVINIGLSYWWLFSSIFERFREFLWIWMYTACFTPVVW